MSNILKLQELAEQSLKEMELIQAEKLPQNNIDIAQNFLSIADTNDKSKLLNLSNYDFLFMIVCFFNNHEYTFDEIKHDVDKVKIASNSWQANCREPLKTLNQLYGNGLTTEENNQKINRELDKLGLRELGDKYNLSMVFPFMFFFINFKYLADKALNLNDYNPFESKYKNTQTTYKSFITPKQKIEKLNELMQKSGLIEVVDFVKKYKNELITRHNQRQKVSAQSIKCTKELLDVIKEEDLYNIGLIHSEWIKYLNPNVLKLLFEIVFENISNSYSKKVTENKKLQNIINKSQVSTFLYNHNINPNSLEKECLDYLELLEKEEFCIVDTLNFLHSLNINLVEFLNIHYLHLKNLDHEKMSILLFLLNSKYISNKTLSSNIFLIENGFSQIISNYEILKPIIDVNNSYYNDLLLLKPIKVLKRMLEIIAEYDLTRNNYMFLLCNFEYLNIYDLLLENDIPVYLFISICETENPLLTIKRILIYKAIGENYKTNTMLLKKDVKEENKFICSNEELDSFIIGELRNGFESFNGKSFNEIKSNDIVKYLDKNFINSFNHNVYDFNGILISRPKFIRQLSACQIFSFESIINSLISNSILSDEECDTIKSLSNSYSKKLS